MLLTDNNSFEPFEIVFNIRSKRKSPLTIDVSIAQLLTI